MMQKTEHTCEHDNSLKRPMKIFEMEGVQFADDHDATPLRQSTRHKQPLDRVMPTMTD